MRFSLISFLLLALFINTSTLSQNSVSEKYIEEIIEKHSRVFLKNKEMNSISVGVFKDENIYTAHFGELEKGQGNAPNDETIYEIASVTKTMTGYLVARAVLEEKLKLDDDIRTFLDDKYPNLTFENKPIAIQHLLTHTSGLPKFLPIEMNEVFESLDENVPYEYERLEQTHARDDFFSELKNVRLKELPGTHYLYSNAGAEILGHILEKVYQQDFDTLLKEAFLDNYGMTNTGIVLSDVQKEKMIKGYWMKNDKFSPNQINAFWGTGAGVKSTLRDMMHYVKLQLNENDPIVIKSREELYARGKTAKVGFLWNLWADKYGPSYNHHGGTSGMQNWLFVYPRHNLGISIFTNHSGPKTPNKLRKVVQKILKDLLPKV